MDARILDTGSVEDAEPALARTDEVAGGRRSRMEHEAVRAAAVPWVGGERAQRFDCASGQGQDAELAGLGRARLQADLWLVAVEVHDIGPAERERLADARAAREQDREERPPPDVGLGLDAVDRARDFAIVEHAVARCDVVLGDAARRVDHPGVEEIPAVARRADDDAQERERLIELHGPWRCTISSRRRRTRRASSASASGRLVQPEK